MPTATTTVAREAPFSTQRPLKASSKQLGALSPTSTPTLTSTANGKQSRSAALRSLYNRAARAFVLRDIPLTHSLLRSAFDLLTPPGLGSDPLAELRRKWDVLRITFESTVYASPPPSTECLPETLRAILSESPHKLLTSIYNRSLSLFTPCADSAQKTILNAAYLPTQVLTTLIYSSIKLDAPDVGRLIIEDWLARREPRYPLDGEVASEQDDYVKVLDLYCLHILPKLDLWEYAKEFLEYESEMPSIRREHLKTALNNLYIQATTSRSSTKATQPTGLPTPSPTPSFSSRPYSPAPSSSSSSSSSLSTTSTHTVIPSNPRNRSTLTGFTNISQASSSSSSIASDETATPRATRLTTIPNGHAPQKNSRPQSKSRTVSSSASSSYSPRTAHLTHEASTRSGPPSMYSLIRATVAPYLTSRRTATFMLIFVLVPLISFLLRMRRRRRMLMDAATFSGGTAATVAVASSNADLVRRRLQAAHGGVEAGFMRRAWSELVRAVGDTVKMAGSGLV